MNDSAIVTGSLVSGNRRRLCLGGMAVAMLGVKSAGAKSDCAPDAWPLWRAFTTRFIQPDGRVLDASTPQRHSSSEGQSYGMFFALLVNDPQGNWYCNDDSGSGNLNPVVDLENPVEGQYDIWIASGGADTEGTLEITEQANVGP